VLKQEEFSSQLALDIWKELYDVSIVSIYYPEDTFSYEVSARLPKPKIKVSYIEFFPDE